MMQHLEQWIPDSNRSLGDPAVGHFWPGQDEVFVDRAFDHLAADGWIVEEVVVRCNHRRSRGKAVCSVRKLWHPLKQGAALPLGTDGVNH